MECPCKDCPQKGCGAYHDICPEHTEWKEEFEKEKQVIQKKKEYLGRGYIKDSTFNSRTHRAFKSSKKERH